MWQRSWQRQLDDPGSDIARRVEREKREREIAEASRRYHEEHAEEIRLQHERTQATRAAGLVPCDCGAPASCWIRSAKLRYSAANCPEHADNTLQSFRDAKLAEREYDVSPVNVEHWMQVTAGELAS